MLAAAGVPMRWGCAPLCPPLPSRPAPLNPRAAPAPFCSAAEITSQHVVPLGYLLTLITLFLFLVLDRVAYTLGSPAGKAAAHAA